MIPGPTNNYRQNCPRWIERPLLLDKTAASCNIVRHQWYALVHYLSDIWLLFDLWKKVIVNLVCLTSFEQQHVPHNCIKIVVFAKQTAENDSEHRNPTAPRVNREQDSTPRLPRIQSLPNERAKNDKPGNYHMNHFDEESRSFPSSGDPKKSEVMPLSWKDEFKNLWQHRPHPFRNAQIDGCTWHGSRTELPFRRPADQVPKITS